MTSVCGDCGASVQDAAGRCPECGASRTRFRPRDLAQGGQAASRNPVQRDDEPEPERKGFAKRAVIGGVAVLAIFLALSVYTKHSHLENVRRKCIETFGVPQRCDCIVGEISKNTYSISFVPMFRFVSGLSQQRLGDIIRESAMACVERR